MTRTAPLRWVTLYFVVVIACFGCAHEKDASKPESTKAQSPRWSVQLADSTISRHPNPAEMEDSEPAWRYSSSFAVHAIGRLGVETGNQRYIDYAKDYAEPFVEDNGDIDHDSYDAKKYRLDDILPGRGLFGGRRIRHIDH